MKFTTKKSVLKIYLFLAVVASAGLAIWRTILLKEHCNPYDMSFQDGALPYLQAFEYTLLAICALLSTSAFFLGKVKFGFFGGRASTTSVFICAICGFVFAAFGILALAYYSDSIFNFDDKTLIIYSVFSVASLIFMFLTAIYFLWRASTTLKNSPYIATLSLVLPCFCIAYLVASYFNPELPLLDFNRVTSEIAFVAALMFMLSEARIAIDSANYPFRFVASLVCIVCICSHILPLLLLAAFWEMSINLSLIMEASLSALLIYALFAAFNAIRTMEESQ